MLILKFMLINIKIHNYINNTNTYLCIDIYISSSNPEMVHRINQY